MASSHNHRQGMETNNKSISNIDCWQATDDDVNEQQKFRSHKGEIDQMGYKIYDLVRQNLFFVSWLVHPRKLFLVLANKNYKSFI